MKKYFLLSLCLHLAILFLFIGGHGGGKGGNGTTAEEETKGHFLGQPKESQIDIVSVSKEDLAALDKERKKQIAKMKADCGKDAYGGIGVRGANNFSNTIMWVSEVGTGTPADAAGIVNGDVIISDQDIKGTPGTQVTVKIERFDRSEKKTVVITRELICYSQDKVTVIPRE